MWETGREGEKEARKDYVDPMSRGRPNNYSARARSKFQYRVLQKYISDFTTDQFLRAVSSEFLFN